MAPHTPPETGQASCPWDLFECMEQLSQWIQKKTDSRVFCVTARLDTSLPPGGLEMLAEWAKKGLKMIQWHYPKILSQVPSSLLWQTAKTGIWNHVSGRTLFEKGPETVMARFVLNNPHVVHSFELPDDPTFFSSLNAYDTIAPLPGKPLWQTLSGPSDILSYLARYSVSHMARLRWNNGILISLGRDIVFHFQPPSDLPPGYLDKVCAMVGAGGSVDLAHVRSNLENAFLIGYAVENGVIVGNSCLKHPRPALVQRLKKVTGLNFSGFVERGYTSVRPEYRSLGVGRNLLEGLTARAGKYKVFSIIDEDNLATRKIARRNNTRKIATYFSEKTNKLMGVWMPEHMMPDIEKETE